MEQFYWSPPGVRRSLSGFEKHFSQTIGRGLCSGCGACVSVCPNEAISIKRAEPDPELVGHCLPNCNICSSVCPGSYIPLTELEKLTFGRVRTVDEQMFGIYRTAYCGYAVDPDTRKAGVAGGVVSALLNYGLDSGQLDCAIVAGWDEKEPWKVAPKIATSKLEVINNAKSKYSISQILTALREAVDKGFTKIGVVALPCYTIALRKMKLHNLKIVNNVKLIIGLYCLAHTYIEGTEYVIRDRFGVQLKDVEKMAFRAIEYPGKFTVWTKSGQEITMELMAQWGMAPTMFIGFPIERCFVCLDHLAELADISAGDVWGRSDLQEEGVRTKTGHTGIFLRTAEGERFGDAAIKAHYIEVIPASTPEFPMEKYFVINPGWFRKKVGNVVRIRYRQKYGWPVPRVE